MFTNELHKLKEIKHPLKESSKSSITQSVRDISAIIIVDDDLRYKEPF